MDRLLTATIAVSLVGHALASILPLAPMPAPRVERARRLKLVSKEPAQFPKRRSATSELKDTAQARLSTPPPALPAGFEPSGAVPPSAGGGIVVRPIVGWDATQAAGSRGAAAGAASSWASNPPRLSGGAIDLTNIQEAAGGNPVLLSYFGAVREQIQRVADIGAWPASIGSEAGVIYISFVIQPRGSLREAGVVAERSSSSRLLQDAALKLVTQAAPFPPIPPSYLQAAPEMTILVPIEFSRTGGQ